MKELQEQTAQVLATGATHRQVALALGVTEARVAQLASDPEIMKRVEELALEHSKRVTERVQAYSDLEKTLLAHINTQIGLADFKDTVAALKVVSGIQLSSVGPNRSAGANAPAVGGAVAVHIALPEYAAAKLVYTTNERNEILTIEDKPLVSMPSDSVEAMLSTQTKEVRAKQERSKRDRESAQ